MKLTVLFLVLGLFSANAKGLSQTISFSGKKVSINAVFEAVEKQTGYNVFANKELLRNTMPVSLTVKNMPLTQFLDLTFRDQPIDYEINNKTIFIKKKAAPAVSPLTVSEGQTVSEPTFLQVTGTVTGSDSAVLEGATVVVKGTTVSTTTNANGRFTINAEPDQVLVITYVGYTTLEVPVRGRTNINIVLQRQVQEGDLVVITALGISKRAKSLTYNVQEIKGDDISDVNNGNFVNSLVGKVAGATINTSAAGTGSSSRVVMRGTKSLFGNNNALYVVDGIPMPNNIRGQAEDIFSGAGQTGDFVSNINPEDIESVSVLSGPAAAALYGGSAANGVIIINTKKGRRNRTDVSVVSTTSFTDPLILPKFQNTYGQTEVGSYYSWGDKLTTPSSFRPRDFFQTGINNTNSVSLSTGTDKSQTYLSLGNVSATGIIPNNDFKRYNFTARNTSTFLNDKMNLDISFMAGLVNEQNMISQGQYFNPLIAVYLFPPGDDFGRVKAFERHNPSRNLMTQFWPYGDNGLMMQNPYWVAERNLFQNNKERYMTTVSLRYNLAKWLNLSGRAKLDKSNERNQRKFAASTNQLFASEYGFYGNAAFNNRQIYAEGLANINYSFNRDFSVTANIGGAIEDIRNSHDEISGRLLGTANLYTFENLDRSANASIFQRGQTSQKQSLFGTTQWGYKDAVFLDITARNDWASTLAGASGQSFFYPSIGLSGVLTDLLPIRTNEISYLKIRASYSEVGNEPPFGLTNLTRPIAGTNGLPVSGEIMPNPGLKPELTKSWEAGINAAFFNGALRLDATVYTSRTYNQTFQPTRSSTVGFLSIFVNAGRVDNKGIEASLRYTKQFGGLNWSTYATYAANRNKIVEMLKDWKNPLTGEVESLSELNMSGTGSYRMVLKEGGSMGDIYVNTLRVDEHGAIYVDPSSQTVVADNNRLVYAGNSNPRHNIGWGNTFRWKGINLNILATARIGGVVVSNTQAMMDAFGVSKASADARDAGGAIVNGRPIPAKEYYQVVGSGASGGIASRYVYSATNARIAEISLGYDIPVGKFVRFVKSANVSLVGRNLLLLYNSAPFDPEVTANTRTYFQGIDYFMMPSLRSLGFSVKLNF
ncbi:MAG TPA: SusC/RagA family TonB-linked outer membrane protein [Flavisolibacter sp.]|nr:SusC/RagA family TonB-linked outer membrane protein [Flavisolibacter sp.]